MQVLVIQRQIYMAFLGAVMLDMAVSRINLDATVATAEHLLAQEGLM
jgi:hypothetical protein